jgi:hypothetical protein
LCAYARKIAHFHKGYKIGRAQPKFKEEAGSAMKQEKQVLRIEIDGHWEAGEFAASFNALNRLYALRLGLALELEEFQELEAFDPRVVIYSGQIRFQSARVWRRILNAKESGIQRDSLVSGSRVSARISELIEPKERLTVRRITYGSPGFKDLAGLGEIIGHLKDFLLRLIEHHDAKDKRALDNEQQRLTNEQLKIEIAKGYIEIAQELGYTKRETRQLVAAVMYEQKPLIKLIAARKITSASAEDDSQ